MTADDGKQLAYVVVIIAAVIGTLVYWWQEWRKPKLVPIPGTPEARPRPDRGDLARLFADGQTFTVAADVRTKVLGTAGQRRTIAVTRVGELAVTSGELELCDAATGQGSGDGGLARTLASGRYPVEASVTRDAAGDERIAAVRVVFAPGTPMRWERDGDAFVDTGEVAIYDLATPDAAVTVASGWGDGVYAGYWGLAADGAPLCFVVDFEVIP